MPSCDLAVWSNERRVARRAGDKRKTKTAICCADLYEYLPLGHKISHDVVVINGYRRGLYLEGLRVSKGPVLNQWANALARDDSHALDRGQPLATLCLREVAALYGVDGQRGAEARRKAWMAAGGIIDDLSAPVLVFNLRAATGSALEQVLDLHRQQGEPVFITYRQLQSGGHFEPLDPAMRTVFICENPSIVSAAAREIGPTCQPIICTNGQPASAAKLLLSQLGRAGVELFCHADFDWAKIGIRERQSLAQFIKRKKASTD
jgi:uncharacterized protein (TIGR02679 family)